MPLDARATEPEGDVYRLACLELRGGNGAAVYQAEMPGLEVWVSCRPLAPAARGGDLYYLSVCSRGSVARVTIADVAGHGELVSASAESLRQALRAYADIWDQSGLVRRLNDSVLNTPAGGQFATAFLLSHYAETGELLFTNAGHPPPVWYRSASREWTYLLDTTPYSREIADLPLGIISGTAYRQTGVQIEQNDLLLLYTDGVSESADPQGARLGPERLLRIANDLPTASAPSAGEAFLEGLARFRGSASAMDDQTVVALRRLPRSAKLSDGI